MRKFNFDDHLKRKKEFTIIRLEKGKRKLPRGKEKSSEELKIIMELIKKRFEEMIKKGEIEKIGKRKWKIKI
ncbi:MAG: hypothetical protein ABDH25_07300 [Dictyoglomaceae bacterium]